MAKRETIGIVQIYTGTGRGKTTAALGLALRASGAGMRVYIQQFMKRGNFSEIRAIRRIKNIEVGQCGRCSYVRRNPTRLDYECARRGMLKAARLIASGRYDLIILDEINVALNKGIVSEDGVIDMINSRPSHVGLVLTGRDCPKRVRDSADLITEMRNIRHPFDRGACARRGIEY